MFELIERLRQKPEHKKKQIAFLVSITFAGIIFAVWLSILLPSWKEDILREREVNNLEPSPASAMTETLGEGLSSISSQFKKIKDAAAVLTSEPEYYNATETQIYEDKLELSP